MLPMSGSQLRMLLTCQEEWRSVVRQEQEQGRVCVKAGIGEVVSCQLEV